MPKGPKPRTASNSDRAHAKVVRHEALDPPSDLAPAALAEYDRLVGVLEAKGTLDRVDLGAIAEAARIKDWLDRAYELGVSVADVVKLTNVRRGLFRELGLTLQPSRSVVRTNPVPAEDDDPIAKLIKISG